MKGFRDPECVSEIQQRIRDLSVESPRQWGRMTVNQMVCHLTDAFQTFTGERQVTAASSLWKRTVLKWIAIYVPLQWPKGRIATVPEVDPLRDGTPPAEFAHDIERLEQSLRVFVETASSGRCVQHALFGLLSPNQWLRFGYLHADHHLRQFGA